MTGLRLRAFALAGALAAASLFAGSSAMAASFDGTWRLVGQTTNGHCGILQYNFAVSGGRINNYPVGYLMGWPAALGGAVSRAGQIKMKLVAGPRVANGDGRLGRLQGRGKWAGQGPSGTCSGIWTATRLQVQAAFASTTRN